MKLKLIDAIILDFENQYWSWMVLTTLIREQYQIVKRWIKKTFLKSHLEVLFWRKGFDAVIPALNDFFQ